MKNFFDKINPYKKRDNDEVNSARKRKKAERHTARVVFHFLADGNYETAQADDILVHPATTDFYDVVQKNFDEYIVHNNRHYAMNDYLAESYIDEDEQHRVVLHVRYILDLEKTDFLDFLESAAPADFVS